MGRRQAKMKITILTSTFMAVLHCSSLFASPSDHGISEVSGAEQARKDTAAGHLQICEAGTRGVYAPGVPLKDARFINLAKHRLPNGCTTPNASLWVEYARGYNTVVVEYVKTHTKQ